MTARLTRKKLGRNKPCWCGSEKKYKKSHLNREKEKPLPEGQFESRLRKIFSSKYCCCPSTMKQDCSGNIIKAHTISKNSSLKKISKNGHVYGFVPSFSNLDKGNGIIYPELIGIKKASTFTGFCSFHDNMLFSPFEDKVFSGAAEQVFLIGYRSLCREFFTKTAQINIKGLATDADKGKSIEDQRNIQNMLLQQSIGVDAGYRDIKIHKHKYDQALISKNYNDVYGYVIQFESILPFSCSGATYTEFDFYGNKIQNLLNLDEVFTPMCFSIISSEDTSFAVFTWINNESNVCERFIESLISTQNNCIFSALLRYAFQSFENVFISPEWWGKQSDKIKQKIVNRYATSADPFKEIPDECLLDDGVKYGEYKIKKRFKVNY